MSVPTICRRGAQVPVLCGLCLALLIATGCGPKAAAPAPAKPKAEASQTNALAAAQTNAGVEHISVFENLLPPSGKDPFFPDSHRRDPKIATSAQTGAPVDAVLVLKAIIRTSKHSQAVINNEIMEAGEEQPVRVPNGHVRVRCIEIGDDYVLIQVEGEAEPKRLMMAQKKS